jgi:pullulanase/glycogen debranching enzyme
MASTSNQHTLFGAFPSPTGVDFSVWAPQAKEAQLVLFQDDGETERSKIPLQKQENGIFHLNVKEAHNGTKYKYIIDDNGPFPDPASRYQPHGVHGCSQVVNHSSFSWSDQLWKGVSSLDHVVLYELHIGMDPLCLSPSVLHFLDPFIPPLSPLSLLSLFSLTALSSLSALSALSALSSLVYSSSLLPS